MPLEIVQGESVDRTSARALADYLRSEVEDGTLYLGYPVLATADDRINVDALLVGSAHGLVAFHLAQEVPTDQNSFDEAVDLQDRLYRVLESHLGRHESLRSGRQLAIEPRTATIFAAPLSTTIETAQAEDFFGELEALGGWLKSLDSIDPTTEQAVQAALQRVTTIKPAKKRTSVQASSSRGAKLKIIERGIANLDRWQKAAAIESPEGPQRIRGLAGSGKTVVLALKAAYLHAQHPEWRIALTFHSRALYQQIDDLVTRFSFEHSNDRPDEDFLQIVHSWGSRSRPGVYSLIAASLGEVPRDWTYARAKYGMDDAFKGVCGELLDTASARDIEPIFDAVLIDEAQDLPPEFFRLIYLFTKQPKRIVWGYDELQRLSEAAMPTTDEMFGLGHDREPLISLQTGKDEPRRDIVLPVCYRNTPWALSTAHALGLGIYRRDGLVQHPDQPSLWRDIGYNVLSGRLEAGSRVRLERSAGSSPAYFNEHVKPEDAVVVKEFADESAQDAWVADQIVQNLSSDELEHDDILVVLPDPYRAKSRAPRLTRLLRARGIDSHLVGVNTSVDEVFRPDSIAIAHIFRAKGNEAPMVYVIDAHRAVATFNAVTGRNTLFTAITRSRAWVRITGHGDQMDVVAREIQEVIAKDYQLDFTIPTMSELKLLRHIHRERSEADEENVKRATDGLTLFVEALDRGEMELEDLPPALRTRLISLRSDAKSDDI